MKKFIVLLGAMYIILMVAFCIWQDKQVPIPKKIEINLDDSYILYTEDYYNYERKDSDITEYKFTKNKCIKKWYCGETSDNNEDYEEYTLDQTTYLEVMNTFVNKMNFFTMEPDGGGSSFTVKIKIRNGDLYREIEGLDSEMWEQIDKLLSATDPHCVR